MFFALAGFSCGTSGTTFSAGAMTISFSFASYFGWVSFCSGAFVCSVIVLADSFSACFFTRLNFDGMTNRIRRTAIIQITAHVMQMVTGTFVFLFITSDSIESDA